MTRNRCGAGGFRAASDVRPTHEPSGRLYTFSGDQLSQLFLEPAEDAGLGLADGVGGDAQLGGDVGRGVVVNGDPPEGRPGAVLELGPHQP